MTAIRLWIKDWFWDPNPDFPGQTRKQLARAGIVEIKGKWYYWGNELVRK